MNPAATLRLRRFSTAAAVSWALVALVLSLAAQLLRAPGPEVPLRTSVLGGAVNVYRPGPGAAAQGITRGDRLLAVDETPVLRWFQERRFETLRADVPNRYRIEKRDGTEVVLDLLPEPPGAAPAFAFPLYLALLAVGLAYLGLGLAVWRLRPGRADSWAFVLFCSAMATQLFSSFENFHSLFGYERLLMNLPLLGATTFHLFTVHPSEPAWLVRQPRIRMLPYALAGVLATLVLLERPLGLASGRVPLLNFTTAITLGFASVAILALERRRLRTGDRAVRADVMFLATFSSFVPVLVLLVAQMLMRWTLPVEFALLWFALFPVAVAYGIVRRQLFDIRMVARSSVGYGAATLVITGLFALLITSASTLVSRFDVNARWPWLSIGFLFFAILVFNPVRVRMQGVVDRFFDRDRVAYRKAVREISEAMVSMLSVREIVERILVALSETMGIERALVLLLHERSASLRPEAWRGVWDAEDLAFELPGDHPLAKRLWMRRQEISRADFDDDPDPELREACREAFDRLEVELLVPILFGVDLLGVIGVGRKISGETLASDDVQLLRTLANQSAIAIENARAFDEIEQLNETLEARVAARTGELRSMQNQLVQSEKMKALGQLVAGIAHELNNPIGFVHANLKLVDEYVARLLEAQERGEDTSRTEQAIERLLSRSREGTERVKRIVQDLKVFSRADQVEFQDADLNQEIDRTLTLMEPRLKGTIRVVRDYGELPPVRCQAGQLNQVFMNLLMNACDALGRRGTIEVRTRATPKGVRLEFADDGPGIPEELRSRIFDPFFTTKAVGQGTGLGLSLSHGIVERHGGRIHVDAAPAGGARFVIDLPREAPEPAAETGESSSAAAGGGGTPD